MEASADRGTLEQVRFALWCGLFTGLGEAVVYGIKRFLRHRWMPVGDDAFWAAPLAESVLFLAALGILLLLFIRRPPARRWPAMLIALPGLSAFSIFMLWGKLHWAAALLLALGIGLRLGSWLLQRLPRVVGTVRRTTPILAAAVVGIWLVVTGNHWWADHRQPPAAAPPGAPNVLLIILDTVRSFSMSLYGYRTETTPGLTRWARQGTVFERAFAPSSWTLPSHAMMFTGDWSMTARVAKRVPLPRGAPTLAEVLSNRGYVTGGFVANLVYTTRASGLARGFGHWEDYPRDGIEFLRSATLPRILLDRSSWKWMTRRHPLFSWKRGDQVTDGALRWIRGRQSHPWFAFLNYMEAHDPWFVPAPWDTTFGADVRSIALDDLKAASGVPAAPVLDRLSRAYDGAIRYLDAQVARLLDSLQANGILKNTIVVIAADHGEQLGDHGTLGHGTTLYRPVVQVPLLVLAPGCGARGLRPATPVSLADLPATILALQGSGGDHPLPGTSFQDLVCGSSRPADPVFSVLLVPGKESQGFVVSVAADSLRYIRKGSGSGELYDFDRDPWETSDLAGTPQGAVQVERLNRMIDSLLSTFK